MSRLACAAIATLAACGDNRTPEVDSDAPPDLATDASVVDSDAPAGALPDLTLIAAQMNNSVVVTQDVFLPNSCEVLEQCVGASGTRKLLRFDTVTANLGTADLDLGVPPPAGTSDAVFTWSPCHGHHHVTGYAVYELRDDQDVVLSGHKQAFCLQDIQQIRPGAPSHGFNCGKQGMSAGWADIYGRALSCQWIDITDVPSGTYTLRVHVNPSGMLPDSDLANNEYTLSVPI
jgi:hypothetical protein